jgi:hypothetical protein
MTRSLSNKTQSDIARNKIVQSHLARVWDSWFGKSHEEQGQTTSESSQLRTKASTEELNDDFNWYLWRGAHQVFPASPAANLRPSFYRPIGHVGADTHADQVFVEPHAFNQLLCYNERCCRLSWTRGDLEQDEDLSNTEEELS